jgi:hypothetical protein
LPELEKLVVRYFVDWHNHQLESRVGDRTRFIDRIPASHQKRTQWQLQGKLSWLRMLRTDQESIADCGQDLEQIKTKSQALLLQYQSSEDSTESRQNLRRSLYQANAPIDNAEASRWQSQLLERPDLVPFSIILESNMDLMWFSTEVSHNAGKTRYYWIDLITQKILAYRNTKQLLGDNYRLINRQRNLQH